MLVKAVLGLGLVALLLAWSDMGRLWALARGANLLWLAGAAGSKTLAATVVLLDRRLGVIALGLVAAATATIARTAGPIGAPIVGPGVLAGGGRALRLAPASPGRPASS
ncbi:MAG: hypothetical protein ACRD1S_09695 [Vicinamibacterales bacterium]